MSTEQLRFGILGAAWIAERALVPAIKASRNATVVALASRTPARAEQMAAGHGVGRVHESYERLLEDSEVDAVYIPLVNSLHREWTVRALEAGKHVLCEKPLAMNAGEAEVMAGAATGAGKVLMEALMYRFHPRLRRLREETGDIVHLAARFGFPLDAPGNYRLDPALGGGALLDVGSYGVSAARWFLGEPDRVQAVAHLGPGGVDMSVAAVLGFAGGATATVWGSFESPEDQELVLVGPAGTVRIDQPFTSWRDPDDPYQLMVEAFADAVLEGTPPPITPAESVANLRVLDAIRRSAEAS